MPHTPDERTARIARFQTLVDDDPENELALFSLGQALQEARRPAEAEGFLKRAYVLQPDLMMAWYRRGECLVQLGRWEEAREMAQRTLDLAISQHHVGPRQDAEEMLEEIADALTRK
jgi:tetratricopeptide (TPR) repeat protein